MICTEIAELRENQQHTHTEVKGFQVTNLRIGTNSKDKAISRKEERQWKQNEPKMESKDMARRCQIQKMSVCVQLLKVKPHSTSEKLYTLHVTMRETFFTCIAAEVLSEQI